MPGSNPLFGLNTLGGALSIQTKDGRNAPGTRVQAIYGSDVRRSLEFEHGGSRASNGVDWYVAGTLSSPRMAGATTRPPTCGQIFGKLGWRRARGDVSVTLAYADNSLTGNGLQEIGFLDRDFSSVYTKPDETDNRSAFLNVDGAAHGRATGSSFSGNAYFRAHRHRHAQRRHQRRVAGSVALSAERRRAGRASLAAGYITMPGQRRQRQQHAVSVPALRRQRAAERRAGREVQRPDQSLGDAISTTAGFSGQVTRRAIPAAVANLFTVGGGFDAAAASASCSRPSSATSTPIAASPARAHSATAMTGGDVDGEPFDTRVDLDGSVHDVERIRHRHAAARGARGTSRSRAASTGRPSTTRDLITPGGEPGSLDGEHVFSRFNPAVGVTFDPSPRVNLYAGYNEGSRAATSIELGCADPEQPCKLPNAMAGDPPLDQVVTRTVEAGVRSQAGAATWHAGTSARRTTTTSCS